MDSCRRLFDLTGRVALVTGGGGGLGAEIAQGLADFGARVVVADIDAARARDVAGVNRLTPTWTYPFVDWIAVEGDRVARWLHQGGRIKTEVTVEDFKRYLVPTFMDATYRKLGWKIPGRPPYFPAGTSVATLREWVRSETQYRQLLPYHLPAAQPFPEGDDLVAPWSVGGKVYRPR